MPPCNSFANHSEATNDAMPVAWVSCLKLDLEPRYLSPLWLCSLTPAVNEARFSSSVSIEFRNLCAQRYCKSLKEATTINRLPAIAGRKPPRLDVGAHMLEQHSLPITIITQLMECSDSTIQLLIIIKRNNPTPTTSLPTPKPPTTPHSAPRPRPGTTVQIEAPWSKHPLAWHSEF